MESDSGSDSDPLDFDAGSDDGSGSDEEVPLLESDSQSDADQSDADPGHDAEDSSDLAQISAGKDSGPGMVGGSDLERDSRGDAEDSSSDQLVRGSSSGEQDQSEVSGGSNSAESSDESDWQSPGSNAEEGMPGGHERRKPLPARKGVTSGEAPACYLSHLAGVCH